MQLHWQTKSLWFGLAVIRFAAYIAAEFTVSHHTEAANWFQSSVFKFIVMQFTFQPTTPLSFLPSFLSSHFCWSFYVSLSNYLVLKGFFLTCSEISNTVVPRKTSTPFNNEIALRWTFCDRKTDRFTMVSMGEFRFAMIGSLLREPILAERRF